jgi:cytochrome c biogenesis protein CcmG/thiol:disulfide interchange protein DsbE
MLCGCASQPGATAPAVKLQEALRSAPDFSLKDSEGKEVRLSDYAGQVVALNFWATWCSPCRSEVPWLNDLQIKNAAKGFSVIGISMDEQGWTVVKPFLSKLTVNYRVVIGNRETSRLYGGVDVLPSTFLIDRAAKIVSAYVGVVNRNGFERDLERLLMDAGTTAITGGGTYQTGTQQTMDHRPNALAMATAASKPIMQKESDQENQHVSFLSR